MEKVRCQENGSESFMFVDIGNIRFFRYNIMGWTWCHLIYMDYRWRTSSISLSLAQYALLKGLDVKETHQTNGIDKSKESNIYFYGV